MNENNLIDEFEHIIMAESRKIFNVIYQMYINKEKTNKMFHDLIESIIDTKFFCFKSHIINKVIQMIPIDLYISNDENIFISHEEYTIRLNQSSETEKIRLQSIEKLLISDIINFYYNNGDHNTDILDLLNSYSQYFTYDNFKFFLANINKNLLQHNLCVTNLTPLCVKKVI